MTSGTSFSAACVSGIAALLLERNPALKPDDLRAILTKTARDLGAPGRDDLFGAGEADAYAAVTAAVAAPLPVAASASPCDRAVRRKAAGSKRGRNNGHGPTGRALASDKARSARPIGRPRVNEWPSRQKLPASKLKKVPRRFERSATLPRPISVGAVIPPHGLYPARAPIHPSAHICLTRPVVPPDGSFRFSRGISLRSGRDLRVAEPPCRAGLDVHKQDNPYFPGVLSGDAVRTSSLTGHWESFPQNIPVTFN